MEAINTLAAYPVELIERAGRSIWYPFRDWVELEDCQQEAWVGYFTYRKEFDRRIAEGEEAYVGKALRNWVATYARKQKAIMSGYDSGDEQYYSRRRVRALLEFYLMGERVPSGGQQSEAKVKRPPTDGTESHVELLDVGRGWEMLDDASREVLWAAYGPDEPAPGTVTRGDRQKAQRALDRLLDLLNGEPLG